MRTAREGFGTMQSFPCAIQPHTPEEAAAFSADNPTRPLVAGIMMEKMNKPLGLDKENHIAHVQAQMTLKNLYEFLTANGLSPPRSALPWWQGLTLGGVFSTSSHGSGFNVTSMIVSLFWGAKRRLPRPRWGGDAALLCAG
jgi:hypothetical protein